MMPQIVLANPNVLNLVNKDLRDLAASLSSRGRLRSLFERFRDEVIIPSIRTNFERSGRPRWEPLSADTIAWRLRSSGFSAGRNAVLAIAGGGGMAPLIHTGKLSRAATAKARFTIRENQMTYGSWPETVWYGIVHDSAEISARARIPQRQFVMFQPEDIEQITEITIEWVEDRVNEHLRRHYV